MLFFLMSCTHDLEQIVKKQLTFKCEYIKRGAHNLQRCENIDAVCYIYSYREITCKFKENL